MIRDTLTREFENNFININELLPHINRILYLLSLYIFLNNKKLSLQVLIFSEAIYSVIHA